MAGSSALRSPLTILALVAVVGVAASALRKWNEGREPNPPDLPAYCQGLSEKACRAVGFQETARGSQPSNSRREEVLKSADVCNAVGFLCAEVERIGELRILRWPEDTEVITVWVPLPEDVSPSGARDLQRAAVRGIQVWNGHPFPLNISTRSVAENPDITIRWAFSLGGNRLGETRQELKRVGDDLTLRIPSLTLVTHDPNNPSMELTPDQVLLVAAHEMGHALGLPHSDNPRDLMYPRNTARRPTARDYRTMEAVYRIPNGALIRR